MFYSICQLTDAFQRLILIQGGEMDNDFGKGSREEKFPILLFALFFRQSMNFMPWRKTVEQTRWWSLRQAISQIISVYEQMVLAP